MKLSPDSPELTAYALGELPADERAAVEAALAVSPELRAEVAALRDTSERLAREFAAEPAVELAPAQRAAIVESEGNRSASASHSSTQTRRAKEASPSWLTLLRSWREQLIWAMAAAAVLAVTLSLWPRRRSADAKFAELRYQRLPVSPPEAAPTTLALVPQEVGGQPPVQPAPTPDVAQKLRVESRAVDNFGEASKPSLEVPLSTSTETKSQLSRSAGGVAAGAGVAQNAVAPPAGPADSLAYRKYGMDPLLARRFSLSPRPSALQESESVPQADSQRLKETRGVETKVELRSLSESLGRTPALLIKQFDESRGRLNAPGTESYGGLTDNPFKEVAGAPLSTFSLDVDTASYANVRRFLREGTLPPADAVRIEELINYFHYDYPAPSGNEPFVASVEIADCPWKPDHKLVRVGLQAKTVDRTERPRANLVFLLDVSGSMEPENKLPLVKRSLRLLLEKLGERDAVGIVTYAGESRVALEPVAVTTEGRKRINDVIESLRAGSGTAGSAGIQNAYMLATNNFIRGGVNRVLLCTDGDFNIGVTDPGELHRLIEEKAKSGVFLSVLGFGMGNYKDSTMELLADKGNGNYAYVDSFSEARKVLGEQLEGTLITVAKDVKVQVEFNPTRVKSYRLLGYENRILRDRDFNDDTKDAGEVGAGHQITVLYEIEPATPNLAGIDPLRYQPKPEEKELQQRLKSGHEDELLLLKLRYKAPDGDQSRLIDTPVKDGNRELAQAGPDFKFAAAVAGYGMLLRDSPHKGDLTWEAVLRLAEGGLGPDKEGYRAEFIDLARKAQQLSGGR